MKLALQNLLQDKLRFALSVTGIALAVMLILFLLGLRAGVFRSAGIYLDNAPGSVAVMPEGVKSTRAGSGQFLSRDTVSAIASARGVARTTPIILTMAIPELHGKKQVIVLVGYDTALGGGPWNLRQGREPAGDDEVVLDRVLASEHGFSVGDSFEIGGHQLKVVGLSNETQLIFGKPRVRFKNLRRIAYSRAWCSQFRARNTGTGNESRATGRESAKPSRHQRPAQEPGHRQR